MIEWETSEITTKPLERVVANNTLSYAIYAKQNIFLETEGWKIFKDIIKRRKKLIYPSIWLSYLC